MRIETDVWTVKADQLVSQLAQLQSVSVSNENQIIATFSSNNQQVRSFMTAVLEMKGERSLYFEIQNNIKKAENKTK